MVMVGVLLGAASTRVDVAGLTASSGESHVYACRAVDGDTLRCMGERIRLLGVDAPELAGHCRRGRVCAPGDGAASTASLRAALSVRMTIQRVGTDRYGRTLALVRSGGVDLSCHQLEHRQAVYRAAWDNGGRVAWRCPRVVRAAR